MRASARETRAFWVVVCILALFLGPARRVEGDWTATGSLSVARGAHTTTLLLDGTVLVAGGINDTMFPVTCELYDPATGTWETVGSIAAGRYAATATLLTSGKVLIAGGGNAGSAPVVAELYDPVTGTWSPTGAMLGGKRAEHTAVRLSNGKVLVAGGWNDSSPLASCEVYDPDSGPWSMLSGSLDPTGWRGLLQFGVKLPYRPGVP